MGSMANRIGNGSNGRPPTAPTNAISITKKIPNHGLLEKNIRPLTSGRKDLNSNDCKVNPITDQNKVENGTKTSTAHSILAEADNLTESAKSIEFENGGKIAEEFTYPEYVRTLKERECWKLYLKMSAKGVCIAYDTILRGMLTPTEFRSLQRHREQEEAARTIKEQAEAEAEAETEAVVAIEAEAKVIMEIETQVAAQTKLESVAEIKKELEQIAANTQTDHIERDNCSVLTSET